jgi:hypothetical protein
MRRGSSINPSVKQISPDFDTQCTCLIALSGYYRLAEMAGVMAVAREHVAKILLRPTRPRVPGHHGRGED